MSSDEAFVVRVLGALKVARLEAVVVGNVAAILEGAPVTTQDLDLLVRDTVTNRRKITALGVELGSASRLISELSETLRIDLAAQARGRDQVQRGGRSSQGPRTAPDPAGHPEGEGRARRSTAESQEASSSPVVCGRRTHDEDRSSYRGWLDRQDGV